MGRRKEKPPAQKRLEQIASLDFSIGALNREIERLYEDEKRVLKFTWGKPGRAELAAIKELKTMRAKHWEEIRREETKRREIIGQINGIEKDLYREILKRRYIDRQQFQMIADEMNYALDYIMHAHAKALQEFELKYMR